jgi:hypothetical protein
VCQPIMDVVLIQQRIGNNGLLVAKVFPSVLVCKGVTDTLI